MALYGAHAGAHPAVKLHADVIRRTPGFRTPELQSNRAQLNDLGGKPEDGVLRRSRAFDS